jgi:transcriptional regulator with XRE-family HTH domain
MARQPSTAIRTLLADNLIRLRHSRGLTQQALARACGCGTGSIGDIERAALNVTLATLELLTLGLACAPADLLTPIHRPAPPESPRAPGKHRT